MSASLSDDLPSPGSDGAPEIPLKLRFGGSLVEQLGAQLYPSVTAAVAELISNSWDAEARNVRVTIPVGSPGARELRSSSWTTGTG